MRRVILLCLLAVLLGGCGGYRAPQQVERAPVADSGATELPPVSPGGW